MTLHVRIVALGAKAPDGATVARNIADLAELEQSLIRAQDPVAPDRDLWLEGTQLDARIPRLSGGCLEVHYPEGILRNLAAAYPSIPADLTSEAAERWLQLPHPPDISIEQLLLARALSLPELETAGSSVPLIRWLEAATAAEEAFIEPVVCHAWSLAGPSQLVGTDSRSGPVADPHTAPSVLVTRLLRDYPKNIQAEILEGLGWPNPRTGPQLDEVLESIDVADPRALGPMRLAQLTARLLPHLESIPEGHYLSRVSGRLTPELAVLLRRVGVEGVGSGPSVDGIAAKFHWLLQIDPPASALYEQYRAAKAIATGLLPPFTTATTAEEALEQWPIWSRFFVEHFVPAVQEWRKHGRKTDGPLACALFSADAVFSRWVASAYPHLRGVPKPPFVVAYREIRRRSQPRSDAGPCIVVLIDGLAWEMARIVEEEAFRAGIWITDIKPAIASLPTITDVGMLTSVAGVPIDSAWDDEPWEAQEVRSKREALLTERVPGATVRTVFQIEQIEAALAVNSELYVLVWTDVDKAAHRYASMEFLTDHARVSIGHLLSAIAKAVEANPDLKKQKDQLRVVIATDHGWTDLFEATNATPPNLDAARPHHRLYEIPRGLSAKERAEIQPDWLCISGPDFDLAVDHTYLVPSRNVRLRSGTFRNHGGLSQGEVLVPILEGRFTKRPYRGLALVLAPSSPLEKDQAGDVTLVVSNPNEGDITRLRITSLELGLEFEVDRLPAQDSGSFGPITVRPTKSGPIADVEISLTFESEVLAPQRVHLVGPVHVRPNADQRMAARNDSLENMFA